jgi:hypothetical protein
MCLMLYLRTANDLPLQSTPDLTVEPVEPSREEVRQWFSLPTVRFIGAHTRCSCGFPSVIADEPVEYFEGIFSDSEHRAADLRSLQALITLVREQVAAGGSVELYPVSDGDEGRPPKGTLDVTIEALQPDTFFFNERFLYRVSR